MNKFLAGEIKMYRRKTLKKLRHISNV